MRYLLVLLMLMSCLGMLLIMGCKNKQAAEPQTTTTATSNATQAKTGFGSISGTCSVCGKKSDSLLRINLGSLTALICSPACGEKFRATPMKYGTQNSTTAPTNNSSTRVKD